jgi:hypothetical protein
MEVDRIPGRDDVSTGYSNVEHPCLEPHDFYLSTFSIPANGMDTVGPPS